MKRLCYAQYNDRNVYNCTRFYGFSIADQFNYSKLNFLSILNKTYVSGKLSASILLNLAGD